MKWIFGSFIFVLMASMDNIQTEDSLASAHLDGPVERFELKFSLAEISGLVAATPTSVFAHNDEHAIIHEVSLIDGKILRSFALGKPTIAADFEGITRRGQFLYLVTSKGIIYETLIGEDRSRVRYNIYDTGLKSTCEIEGITTDTEDGFLLLCKHSVVSRKSNQLVIYKWRFKDRLQAPSLWLNISLEAWDALPKGPKFMGAGLERDPESSNILIVESKSGGLLEVTSAGEFVRYQHLGLKDHPQAEGVAVMANGDVVIVDEDVKGRLAVYPAAWR